jgi:hypothetical protein
MNKSMTDFITTVKNFSKSKEATILGNTILFVQKDKKKTNVSTFTRQFCERMKNRPKLYELSHLI